MRTPWIVVLAGGDGTRLHSLTRALYGVDLAKQFAVIVGDRSLLQGTIERAELMTSRDRILVIVGAHQEVVARAQLLRYPGVEIVVQPRNLDTGPGILLALARLRARDPAGFVTIMPSDHYFTDPSGLVKALEVDVTDRVVLLGVRPTAPDVELGWIVCGRRIAHREAFEVVRFVEKPTDGRARELLASGAMWNTFIQTGPIAAFWELATRHLAACTTAFQRAASQVEPQALEELYISITPASWSRDVLVGARGLAVVELSNAGWNDWGSPRRVFESLAGSAQLESLLERIRGSAAPYFQPCEVLRLA